MPKLNKNNTQKNGFVNIKKTLNEFSGKLSKYLVLLIEKDTDEIKGTGFIVTLSTIMTPSKNLENIENGIELYLSLKIAKEISTIYCHYPYDGPLSLAYVSSSTPTPSYPKFTPKI